MNSGSQRSMLIPAVLLSAALAVAVLLWHPAALASETLELSERSIDPRAQMWGFLAAALSTAVGALGAGYAVAMVGAAAVGALAEKPELFGRVLILVGLAEGIAIYGLIVSVLILNKL